MTKGHLFQKRTDQRVANRYALLRSPFVQLAEAGIRNKQLGEGFVIKETIAAARLSACLSFLRKGEQLMKRLILISFSAALLTACGGAEEADVAEVETPVVGTEAPIEADVAAAGATATAWDVNNNRMLDRNEFTGMRDDGFLAFNEDEDRERLSRTEFEKGWTEAGFQNGGEVFTAFDDNNDSFLEQGEFFSEDEFAEWDTNGNGILENNEFGYYGAA